MPPIASGEAPDFLSKVEGMLKKGKAMISRAKQLEKFQSDHRKEQLWKIWLERVYVQDSKNPTQMVHTPESLCIEIVNKLKESCSLAGKSILTLNAEFVPLLMEGEVTFFSDNKEKGKLVEIFYPKVTVVYGNLLELEIDMKFDVVCGNPPYQDADTKKASGGGGGNVNSLWPKFLEKSFKICKDNGFVTLVHPSGWRNVRGLFGKIGNIIKSRNIKYLSLHSDQEGMKTFSALTTYDWYVVQNQIVDSSHPKIEFFNKEIKDVDIFQNLCIPNNYSAFKLFSQVISQDQNKCVEVINDSYYNPTTKDYMSEFKTDIFKYPCVKYVKKGGEIDFRYSSKNDKHFGIKKVIFGIGADTGNIIIDSAGEFGLCQFSAAIVGKSDDELQNIYKALISEKFKLFMNDCKFTRQMYNIHIIRLLRKDFWREFV